MWPYLVMKPYYKHNCDSCRYLGSLTLSVPQKLEKKVDLYHCSLSFDKEGTYIARYSDEESDYISSPLSNNSRHMFINCASQLHKPN